MWKLVALVSVALGLAFGGVAAGGGCAVCIDKVIGEIVANGPERSVTLTFSGSRAFAGAEMAPDRATAVVMQVDGNRTKCLEVAVTKTSDTGSLVSYTGKFNYFSGQSAAGPQTYEGRIDVAGAVYEFRVPLDGTPGKITRLDVAAPLAVQPRPLPAPAVASVSQAVTVDETPAPAPGIFESVASPDGQGVLLAIAVVSFLGATLLVERRRAGRVGLVRTESAIEA